MSTGKGSKSIRKSQQGNDLLPSVGFLNTVAKHKATLNQTVINLGSLTTPPEAIALGFIQPSGGTLAALDLQRYKNNVKVMSTTKGLLDNPIDYRITGTSQITLADGASDGEIFTIIVESQPRNGINLVAAQPKVVSYVLPAGTTDIPAGTYTPNRNPGEDVGEFFVVIDRQIQYRNTGNGSSGGDYQELPGLIRMNDYDPINDRKVVLVWVGALLDNPQDSQLALIQTLQGQIDAMVPTLAALAGVSTTVFQTSPNDPDLLAFGAQVIAILNAQVEGPKKIHEISINDVTSTATLNSQLIRFNPDSVANRGTDITLLNMDNSGTFSVFTSTKNVKLSYALRMVVADAGGTGTLQAYRGSTAINTSDDVEGTQSTLHIAGTLILTAGEQFSLRVPTGVPVAGASCMLTIVAESISETKTIQQLAGL